MFMQTSAPSTPDAGKSINFNPDGST